MSATTSATRSISEPDLDAPDPDAPTPDELDPDVVVWEADGQPLAGRGYGAHLADLLAVLDARVVVVPYRSRPLTERELAAPVHVLSGGETSAFSDDPATRRALADLGRLLQRAWSGEATVLGVCLGAQLLARAVAPGLPRSLPSAGMEAGLCRVRGAEGTRRVAQLHYEQIHPAFAELDDVVVTHTNAHSPVQGFRWCESVHGFQFHPEWTPTDLATVLRRHRPLLDERHADPEGALASVAGAVADRVAGAVEADDWAAHAPHELLLRPVAAALARVSAASAAWAGRSWHSPERPVA